MSWVPEVIADNTGKWIPNGLRFATKDEAYAYALDLAFRWTAVKDQRANESADPVNYVFRGGRLEGAWAVADTADTYVDANGNTRYQVKARFTTEASAVEWLDTQDRAKVERGDFEITGPEVSND